MSTNPPTFRTLAEQLAIMAQLVFQSSNDEPLDGDQTEEISMMFQEELNKINGND